MKISTPWSKPKHTVGTKGLQRRVHELETALRNITEVGIEEGTGFSAKSHAICVRLAYTALSPTFARDNWKGTAVAQIFNEVTKENGYECDTDQTLDILARFIENNSTPMRFRDFVQNEVWDAMEPDCISTPEGYVTNL